MRLDMLRWAMTPTLPGPYAADPPAGEVRPSRATLNLVCAQVRALLESSPSFRQLASEQRREIASNLVKISAYAAALWHDQFQQSRRLGQEPVLIRRETVDPAQESNDTRPAPARAAAQRVAAEAQVAAGRAMADGPAADEFRPRAAEAAARVTRQTLNAIAFPTFVADLIQGTFQAIVDASIQQMEAFSNLLANVAKTVDQFMVDNITDNQARDYLVQGWPGHFRLETSPGGASLRVRDEAEDLPQPDFQQEFGLSDQLSDIDDDTAEEVLVPAARRKLASSRHQMLSTMVLMGMQRIVVTSGRIKAKMGFRLDTSDRGYAQSASQFDFRHDTSVSGGGGLAGLFGGPRFRSTTSVAYVSSSKKESEDEINLETDLSGEVDLKFKTDYLPLERLAKPEMIQVIQGNTPNPAGNRPGTAERSDSAGERAET